MAIEVKVNTAEEDKDDKYPYIGVTEGLIVLFTKPEFGFVLEDEDPKFWDLGDHTDVWDESTFTRFNGSITLTQEAEND